MKIDMHCHTKEGSVDAKVPIEDYINSLIDQGFDGMVITDHDSYDGYRFYEENLKDKYKDFVVLKGVEYDTLDAGHFIVIMPTGVDMLLLEIKGMPILLLKQIVHMHGGILGPAHPCGEPFLSIFSTGIFKHDQRILKKFDFIEAFNPCESDEANSRAMELAREYDKPTSGGSDSHKIDCVGCAYTMLEEDISSEDQLIAYIKEKKPMTCGGRHYQGTLKDKIGFWNKFLVWGFYPYNKVGAFIRRRKRRNQLKSIKWD